MTSEPSAIGEAILTAPTKVGCQRVNASAWVRTNVFDAGSRVLRPTGTFGSVDIRAGALSTSVDTIGRHRRPPLGRGRNVSDGGGGCPGRPGIGRGVRRLQ